ncbi:Chromo domain-containing protein [Cucumis melo var. makuwa]|uniref:Chromo domain-containing protein n=1 Tax=Cucumis melo var. makuwa TaxID=1194695 RepID=A0A5D3DEV2_CUCMM|nr:Chromo domain-containing protein [Cucumis melo var. makuwa]
MFYNSKEVGTNVCHWLSLLTTTAISPTMEWPPSRRYMKGIAGHQFMGSDEILKRVGLVAYKLRLPAELSRIHHVFRVSMLRKYVLDSSNILQDQSLGVQKNMTYVERPLCVLDSRTSVEDKGNLVRTLFEKANESKMCYAKGLRNGRLVIPSDYAVKNGSDLVGSLHHVYVIIVVIPKDTHVAGQSSRVVTTADGAAKYEGYAKRLVVDRLGSLAADFRRPYGWLQRWLDNMVALDGRSTAVIRGGRRWRLEFN